MDDIVYSLKSTITKDEEVLLQMRQHFDMLLNDLKEEQETLSTFRMEIRQLEKRPEAESLFNFSLSKMKVMTEYLGRVYTYAQYFNEHFPKLLYYIKRVNIQVSMAHSQVKFQYEALEDPEVMEKFSENIKLLVQLVKTASEHVTQFQNYYSISYELLTQARSIKKNVTERIAALGPEPASSS
jgi:hypothetical protein